MLGNYISLAFKNLKHRGVRSWLTMIGIFIGIAAVVSLISLSNGLQNAVTGQFSTLSPDTLMVQSAGTSFGPPGSGAVRKLTEHDLDIISSINGVEMAIPRLVRSVKVEYNKVLGFKYLGSMPESEEQMDYIYRTLNAKVADGAFLKIWDSGKVIIGADFAKKEEFEKEIKVGAKLDIQNESFEVAGIMQKASSFQLNNVALMMESDMKDALGISDEIDVIVVKVVDQDRVEEVAELIKREMRKDRNQKEGEEDFSVQTPLNALQSINTILNIINLIVSGIAAISLVVGGIGIANTMYTSVLERTREIGVMKAIGAQNSDVLKVFLVESGLLGLAGGVVGAIIGIAFAFAASFIANAALGQSILLVTISFPLVIAAVSFSFIIGLVSGILPAIQASELKPVQALRG